MGTVLRAVAITVGVAAALVLAYGLGYAGYVGYDSLFALIWGQELAQLETPSIDAAYSPTPHPLLNLVGALLAPLGDGASMGALELLSLAGMVLLAVAAYRLGAALFTRAAGVAFAAILLTRPEIVELALYASLDVAFLALVLMAAALMAERPRGSFGPLVLLTLAGLLRPEAWLLSAAYMLWAWPVADRVRLLAVAAAAPVLWVLHDLAFAGDALYSFHGTRAVAERSPRGTGLDAALEQAPEFLSDVTGAVVFWCAVAAGFVVLVRAQERLVLPGALLALSIVQFLAYGLAGLTLYPRFLLPAAAALALLCAAALGGFPGLGRLRWPVAAAAAVAVAVSVPGTVSELSDVRSGTETRARLESDLASLAREQRSVLERCQIVRVPTFRQVPVLVFELDVERGRYTSRPAPAGPATGWIGLSRGSRRSYVVDPLRRDPVSDAMRFPPAGTRTLAETGDWRMTGNC